MSSMTNPKVPSDTTVGNTNGGGNGNGRHKSPILKVAKVIEDRLRSIFNIPYPSLKESLEEVIEEHDIEGKIIPDEEKALLRNVLTFSELAVEDVMVPRADIVFVHHNVSIEDLKKTIINQAHTRIPVCRDTLDDVVGFIHIKDLVYSLSKAGEFNIDDIMRQALFVPPSMKLTDVLLKMKTARVHMALVVDEYGGTSGIVTLEDVVEEIVGEIEDEHDKSEEQRMLVKVDDAIYEASARIEISRIEEIFATQLQKESEKEDFDTLGGMLFARLGRVPSKGEVISDELGFEYEIIDADPRRIKRVLMRRKPIKEEAENEEN